jgi:hypothetical protein
MIKHHYHNAAKIKKRKAETIKSMHKSEATTDCKKHLSSQNPKKKVRKEQKSATNKSHTNLCTNRKNFFSRTQKQS